MVALAGWVLQLQVMKPRPVFIFAQITPLVCGYFDSLLNLNQDCSM